MKIPAKSDVRALRYSRQHGLTLIEMMVSLVISLIVSGVAAGVFISARQTARYSDALSRYQESLRFAQAALADDLRTSGQLGCRSDLTTGASTLTVNDGVSYSRAIDGLDAAVGTSSLGPIGVGKAKLGSDAIRLQFASRDSSTVNTTMASTTGAISIASAATYLAAEPLVIADCSHADIFKSSTAVTAGTSLTPTSALSKVYSARISEVYRFLDRAYYINASDELMQVTGNTESVISDGIEDLQISYGIDTDTTPADGYPNRYVTAANVTTWDQVAAVRVCMLVRSRDQNLSAQSNYTNCSLSSVPATDGRLRFPVSFTVLVRNRGLQKWPPTP